MDEKNYILSPTNPNNKYRYMVNRELREAIKRYVNPKDHTWKFFYPFKDNPELTKVFMDSWPEEWMLKAHPNEYVKKFGEQPEYPRI